MSIRLTLHSRRTSAAGTRESSDESLVVSPGDFLERLFRFRSERRRVRQRGLPCRLRWPARRGSRYSPRRPALRRPRLPQILSPLPTANFQTYPGAVHRSAAPLSVPGTNSSLAAQSLAFPTRPGTLYRTVFPPRTSSFPEHPTIQNPIPLPLPKSAA